MVQIKDMSQRLPKTKPTSSQQLNIVPDFAQISSHLALETFGLYI